MITPAAQVLAPQLWAKYNMLTPPLSSDVRCHGCGITELVAMQRTLDRGLCPGTDNMHRLMLIVRVSAVC